MQSRTNQKCSKWEPGLRKHIPWTAVSSLIGFVLCCVALATILSTSDGREVVNWPRPKQEIPVSVMLALTVNIANLCLSTALSKGYEIAWWLRALKGTELRRLQFDLDIQRRLSAIIGENTRIDSFAVAAILSFAVSVLDGPLIQRASSVTTTTFQSVDVDVEVNVMDRLLPASFSAWELHLGDGTFSPMFRNISRAFTKREEIQFSIDTCGRNTTCVFKLPGPGFDVNCSEEFIRYDFMNFAKETDPIMDSNGIAPDAFYYPQVFGIQFSSDNKWSINEPTRITVTASFKRDSACVGRMLRRSCTLRPAMVQYPVILKGGVATIDDWRSGQNETLDITQVSDGDKVIDGGPTGPFSGSMLGGMLIFLRNLYTSNVTLLLTSISNNSLPLIAEIYATDQSAFNYFNSDISTYGNCSMTWGDPTTDIVNTARELMFRSMVAYSEYNRSAVAPRQLRVSQTRSANTYKSHYEYLGITVACMSLQALVISYMLYGWHRLGRDVSLNPFEIARAMGATVLQDGSSNSRIDVALSHLRREQFRYGEVLPETSDPWAGVDHSQGSDPETSSHELLQHDTRSESETADDAVVDQKPRLGLDRAERVGSIRRGVLY
ncbi:hypothetical protein PG985_001538 [Apiospora marii]|uniref:uncharacterized protein n=1 Tax=Apiospora marii TaxID=335849 RepID=UPI00312D7AC7